MRSDGVRRQIEKLEGERPRRQVGATSIPTDIRRAIGQSCRECLHRTLPQDERTSREFRRTLCHSDRQAARRQ